MNNFFTLILILTPMFIGFLLPKNAHVAKFGERILNALVFLILWVIGVELGLVPDLAEKLGNILLYLAVLIVLTIGSGLFSLYLFDKFSPCPYYKKSEQNQSGHISLSGSAIQMGCLGLGFLMARFLPPQFLPPHGSNTVLLMLLLFLVGLLLKNANISLKDALLNRRGLHISMLFMVSVLGGGLIFAAIFEEVSWSKGLALSSGFGWYSLSGTVMTDAYGAVWGSVALLNDLMREIIALIFIPHIMRYSSSAAIGVGGVTSLDFTLPTLQKAGGNQIVPLVISFGFITNVVSPILMVFFSSLK